MEIIGILVSFSLAILVAVDAEERGMSSFGWGIGVFLFGLIGAIVYLVARKPKIEK